MKYSTPGGATCAAGTVAIHSASPRANSICDQVVAPTGR
jgi:hypothetical protein